MTSVMALALAVVVLGWPTPQVDMAPRYVGDYQMEVAAGQQKSVDLPIPSDYSCRACRIEFSWQIVSPVPTPKGVVLETSRRDVPGATAQTMSAVGDIKTSPQIPYAVVNTGSQTVVIEFHFVAYELSRS